MKFWYLSNNMEFEDFRIKFYPNCHDGYLDEKIRLFRTNPLSWYASLDPENKLKLQNLISSK